MRIGMWICGKLLKGKIERFREHVKQFDKAVSPRTKEGGLAILAIEKDELHDFVLLLRDKVARVAGSDKHANGCV